MKSSVVPRSGFAIHTDKLWIEVEVSWRDKLKFIG